MALRFGLVPAEMTQDVVNGLVYDIEVVNKGHHTVGIHGNRYLYTVLTDHGKAELPASIDQADTQITSPFGKIENKWVKADGRITMELTIPFNTTAKLPLSAAQPGTVRVNGKDQPQEGALTLGSGRYTVSYTPLGGSR